MFRQWMWRVFGAWCYTRARKVGTLQKDGISGALKSFSDSVRCTNGIFSSFCDFLFLSALPAPFNVLSRGPRTFVPSNLNWTEIYFFLHFLFGCAPRAGRRDGLLAKRVWICCVVVVLCFPIWWRLAHSSPSIQTYILVCLSTPLLVSITFRCWLY